MSDIRSEGFVDTGMNFGPTGAMNDNSVPADGLKMKDMVEGAGTSFSGAPTGQQAPRSGAGDMA